MIDNIDKDKHVDDEFLRIAEILASQNDIDVLCELIPFETKKEFIKSWERG